MPYDYIEEYQKQDDETIWEFRDKDAQSKIDISLTETDYANPLSLETMQAQLAKNTKIKLEPIQDLHGYDKPWVGGAGKNLLPLTVDGIKARNTGGTWSGNVYTYGGLTFTILTDNDNNVIGIKANGTNNSGSQIVFQFSGNISIKAGTYTFGLPNTNFNNNIRYRWNLGGAWNAVTTSAFDRVAASDTVTNIDFAISDTYSVSNIILYPILCLSSDYDDNFYPYSNICPISGHDQIDILGCGKNICGEMILNKCIKYNDGSAVAHPDYDCTDFIPIIKNVQYYISHCSYGGENWFYDKNKNPITNIPVPSTDKQFRTFTITDDTCKYIRCTHLHADNIPLQIEVGSAMTTYEPYTKSNDLTISLGQTVYGGTLDLESGELVANKATNKVSELTWIYSNNVWISKLSNVKRATGTEIPDAVCSHYPVSSGSDMYYNTKDQCFGVANGYYFSQDDSGLIIKDSVNCPSTSDPATVIPDAQITYPLATPQTIQLTPHQLSLFKAQNNLTTSQYTKIKVTYRNGVFATLEPATTDNDGLMSRLDKVKLDSIADDATKTESSTTNGNIKINGTETQVYDDSEIKGELSTDTTTIEDNPLNFTTLSAQTAKSTILSLEPIQDLHGYDKPWVGGAGKNRFATDLAPITDNGITVEITDIGEIWVHGTPVSTSDYTAVIIGAIPTDFINKEVVLSTDRKVVGIGFQVNDGNLNLPMSSTMVAKSTPSYNPTNTTILVNVMNNLGTINEKFKVQFELAATRTAFEPYKNICPISGRTEIGILGCGVNLWNPDDMTVGKWINSSGEITNNATGITNTNYIKIDKTLGYLRFSKTGSQELGNYAVAFYDLNKNFISRALNEVSIAIPDNAEYILYGCGFSTDPTIDKVKNAQLQLEYGNQATQYTAYQSSNSLTIAFGQTVYGGTLDVENGVLVVDKGKKKVSDLSWEDDSAQGKYRYSAFISDLLPLPIRTLAKLYCEKYETLSDGRPFPNTPYYCIYSDDARKVYIHDGRYATVTDFTTNEANTEIVYELATPITVQLTPNEISLLKGVNNISTDGDKITLTYRDGSVATLGDLLDLEKKLSDEEPYGFIEHMSILDPAQRIEYIGKNKNYKPVTVNLSGDHLANYNDWHDFFVLKENEPYMIKSDGTVDYALDPNDYTKKFDGSASDITDTTYTGGAFSWIPKIYKYEYVEGSDRYVYFSQKKLNDNYEAIGFIDENGLKHDGVWLPMFYGTEITQDGTVKIMSLATGTPSQSRDTATQKTYIENFSSQAKFFGGPIVNVLADLLIMLGKNSDIQAVFGTGNMSGGNGAQYMKANACLNGGAFYGSSTNTALNKAFHSLVLLTQNQWQRDPYTLCYKGEYIVSPYYKYDLTGASYVNTGVFVTPPSSNNWVYPHKSVSVPHWGAIPVGHYSGSTTTGWADGQYTLATQLTDTTVRVVLRFGACTGGRLGGVRCVSLSSAASATAWYLGASPLLLSKEKTPN